MITNPLFQGGSKKFTRVAALGNKRTDLNIQILMQVAEFPDSRSDMSHSSCLSCSPSWLHPHVVL